MADVAVVPTPTPTTPEVEPTAGETKTSTSSSSAQDEDTTQEEEISNEPSRAPMPMKGWQIGVIVVGGVMAAAALAALVVGSLSLAKVNDPNRDVNIGTGTLTCGDVIVAENMTVEGTLTARTVETTTINITGQDYVWNATSGTVNLKQNVETQIPLDFEVQRNGTGITYNSTGMYFDCPPGNYLGTVQNFYNTTTVTGGGSIFRLYYQESGDDTPMQTDSGLPFSNVVAMSQPYATFMPLAKGGRVWVTAQNTAGDVSLSAVTIQISQMF